MGATLFFLSDLAVARHRFVKEAFLNRAIGLPAYYAGQMLLALTIGIVS
ncbi:MAG: lysoplasmalogenase family protein [Acidobacteriota bacterium]